FDIDRFKQINDRHGHAAGDAVLHEVARRAEAALRRDDRLMRWGGEEFVVIFRHTSLKNAHKVLAQICQEARSGTIRHESNTFRITFSAGVVQMRSRNDFLACIGQADQLLYRAKESGRDRIVVE
ncbi:MAG: GGDEF domain-containing protein, partial [Gammaproteobacteria bacterium]